MIIIFLKKKLLVMKWIIENKLNVKFNITISYDFYEMQIPEQKNIEIYRKY
jgi:hypothetical protein